MALEQRTEVEKDPHEGSWGSRARQVSKEYIPEGRQHVAKTASGGCILATIPQGGRRGRRTSRAGALLERNPSKASAKAPAFIYSGVILLYQLQKNALLRVPASGCERTSACVHRFSS